MKLRRMTGLLTSALVASAAVVGASAPARAADCGTLLPLAVPACGALWGISVPGGSAATLSADESKVGRNFDISYHFHRVGDTLPTADERTESASGHLLHINIESVPYSYATIASGAQDTALTRQANGVKSLDAPVYVSFEHEPDVKTKASRGTPAQFKAAWRHVHDLFVAKGATNAVWVWITTGYSPNFPTYAGFYPGNDVVDWISWEAYSTTACSTSRNVLTGTFANDAGPMYNWLHDGHGAAAGIDVSKPEMISEYGAVYDSGKPGAQGAWYQGISQLLKNQYPDIKAVAKWDNTGTNCQYQMSVSPLTLAGVTTAGHDPYVNQATAGTGQAPVAQFTPTCAGTDCSFDASASTAPGSTIASYSWSFGDGSNGSGVNAAHGYAAGGSYSVTLTVTNDVGDTDSDTQVLNLGGATSVAFVAAASTTANATTESVTVPAAVTAGNGMILLATGASGNAPKAPAGWTAVDSATSSSITTSLWRRVATSADAGSKVTVTFGSIYRGSVHLLAYSGTGATNPVVAYAKKLTAATASSYSTPVAAVPADGDVTISYWACKSSSATRWTTPAGQTVRATAYGTGGGRITSVATDGGPAAAGTTGGLTASPDTSATAFAAWTIVLG
jgi:PKD repeat protein